MEPTKEGLKHCSRGDQCVHPQGPDLPRSEFNMQSRSHDGLQAYCRLCAIAAGKRRRTRNYGYDLPVPDSAPDDDPPDGSIIPATLRRLNGNSQVPAPSSNGAHPWGPIREVEDASILGRMESGQWIALFAELLLRLEQTPLPRALEVPFADQKMAASAKAPLRNRLTHEKRPGVLSIYQRGAKLYVRRGPNWSK